MILFAETHPWTEHIGLVVSGFVTGGGAVKWIRYISENLEPLPPTAGWWSKQLYRLVAGASGHNPLQNAPKTTGA